MYSFFWGPFEVPLPERKDISIWNGDIKAATNVREIEESDYDAMHKDYSESVDALQRAIAVLKKQSHDRKQSLIQVAALQNLNLIPAEAKKTIDALKCHIMEAFVVIQLYFVWQSRRKLSQGCEVVA